MAGSILVIDDEPASRDGLNDVLADAGYQVTAASSGEEGVAALKEAEFDVVITDLKMPGIDGLTVLREVRKLCPQTLTIVVTAHASIDSAVAAIHEGAHDYMLKPLVYDDVITRVSRLLEHRQIGWQLQHLRREVDSRYDFENLVGESAAMRRITTMIRQVAPTSSNVLVTGESGVGKEVVARAIHRESERRDKIFLPVNCGAIPENLLESQLFGHVRGAFTGAVTSQEGLFQRARGGTIFLDEIGELPLGLQVKLLRAIEEKEIHPVGAARPVVADVRIIAATNRDLELCCKEGTFREDLYYRLNVFNIEILPLRDRREDIPVLVDFLVHRHNIDMNRHFKGVDNKTMKLMMAMPWRGNVRELDNAIEHAMIVGSGDWITVDDLPARISDGAPREAIPVTDDLKHALRLYERMHIGQVLERTGGDKRQAAEVLGISLSSLYRKIDELGLNDKS